MSQTDPGQLEPIEKAGIDELRALQLQRLRWSLAHAYDNVRPLPGTPSNASRSPPSRTCATTTRSGCSRSRASRSPRVHASSGTTGKPTVVGYTQRDVDTWATWWRAPCAPPGCGPGWIVHVAYGYGLFTGGLGAHYGAERSAARSCPSPAA
jgi:phenylacetate-CoA ligase